jgi:hypothetical protein
MGKSKSIQTRPIGQNELLSKEDNYNPIKKTQEQSKKELAIKESFLLQGIDREIANAVIGYRPKDIPFIYRTNPHQIPNSRMKNYRAENPESIPEECSLWVGTTDAIYNLANKNRWDDQIPEVIIQWRATTFEKDEQQKAGRSFSRSEVKQLKDGKYLEVEYENVSGLGSFDGEICSIALNVPDEQYTPMGAHAKRNSYEHYHAKRTPPLKSTGPLEERLCEWSLDLSTTNHGGTTILNGFSELVMFNMGEIVPVKEDHNAAYRFTELPKSEGPLLLTSPSEEYQRLIRQSGKDIGEKVNSLFSTALEVNKKLAPRVRDLLANGNYAAQVTRMSIDGILRHPEKIALLDARLSDLTGKQRFYLAQFLNVAVKFGAFEKWMKQLEEKNMTCFVEDVANRNTFHLINWYLRGGASVERIEEGIRNITHSAENILTVDETVDEDLRRLTDGMCTSFMERFVEYLAQEHLGQSLTELNNNAMAKP